MTNPPTNRVSTLAKKQPFTGNFEGKKKSVLLYEQTISMTSALICIQNVIIPVMFTRFKFNFYLVEEGDSLK